MRQQAESCLKLSNDVSMEKSSKRASDADGRGPSGRTYLPTAILLQIPKRFTDVGCGDRIS
jgi:hypothetical protein